MRKVLIAPMTLANIEGEFLRVLRAANFELVFPPKPLQMTEDELLRQLEGISASLAGSEPYSQRVLAAHPQLRIVARVGVGYDAVDVKAATQHGVAVTITPNTNQESVAEHLFMLMLALAKRLIPDHLGTIGGNWPRRANIPLRGRTLGIAGLGRIGKAVAVRAKAFGMRLLAYDTIFDEIYAASNGITRVSFEDLLRQSDYVTLHLPMTSETQHLINRNTLALMKPTAYLLNTGRGGLVCEADLTEALKSGQIAGAGLDVFEEEPPGKIPLFGLENVVVTPHTAGTDLQSRDDMALSAAQAITSLSRGEWPEEKVVNPQACAMFRW